LIILYVSLLVISGSETIYKTTTAHQLSYASSQRLVQARFSADAATMVSLNAH
jgi:hypothetical protein